MIVFSVTLYEKLNELEEKKQSLVDEMEKENRGTPAEERERLLKQVIPKEGLTSTSVILLRSGVRRVQS